MSKPFMITIALVCAVLIKYSLFVDQKTRFVESMGNKVYNELLTREPCKK